MRRGWVEGVCGLMWLAIALSGCRSPEKPAVSPSPTSAEAVPSSTGQGHSALEGQSGGEGQSAPPPGASPAPSKPTTQARVSRPSRYTEPPIEEDETAGVRGTQFVNFVVTSAGKPVEGARVSLVNTKGRSAGAGETDDWGQFHTSLAEGSYKVTLTWSGRASTQKIKVDSGTSKVELSLPQE